MRQLFLVSQNIVFLWVLLAVFILIFAIRQIDNIYHFFRPQQTQARTREWLNHLESTAGRGNGESMMRDLARKQVLRKHTSSSILKNSQRRIYLNLQSVRRQLKKTPAKTISTIPASLWIFDNYNLLYREIKKLHGAGKMQALSRLPNLETGMRKSCPRIYIIARQIISATNNHPQENTIISLLNAYQAEKELTSSELWSFDTVISLCLLEKIVDEAVLLIKGIKIKIQAGQAADRIAEAIRSGRNIEEIIIKEINKSRYRNEEFVAYFFYCLRNLSVDETDVIKWLAQLNGMDQDAYLQLIADMVNKERQREAMNESRISSLIISLKEMWELNWDEAFKNTSKLEAALDLDPAGIYSLSDANTRSRYRLCVEKLAPHYKLSESSVAAYAVQLAETAREAESREIAQKEELRDITREAESQIDPLLILPNHVGTYLVGNGYPLLIDLLKNRPARPLKLHKHKNLLRGLLYLTGIFTISAGLLIWVGIAAGAAFSQDLPMAVLLLVQLGLLAIGIAIHLINSVFTRFIHPLPQLAMDFSQGIPDDCRTFVVMPVIIGSASSGRTYASRLEKFYLANKQSSLYFAILGDLKDADKKNLDEDDAILDAAEAAILELNERYPGAYSRFSLFLRKRQWNAKEKCWMCWERKRGKLEDFNAMLSGETGTVFEVRVGSPETFSSFRYVITLDADTDMIRESAAKLVGIMAHPLNHPVIDDRNCKITSGYAIVQSEICSRVTDSKASFFTRLFTGESGIDSYSTVLSDVYQDTFDEGIFVGKGIYDFRVMHRLLRGMITKNTVLSHDLLESSLTRCAFASGIRMLDTTPPNVAAFAKRDHRWIRGDWQLLPWIFRPSRINLLSRWKMIDNLRRSLTPVASVLSILLTAFFFPQYAWLWIPFVLFSDAWRFVVSIVGLVYQKMMNSSLRIAAQILFEQLSTMIVQTSFNIILLPFNAFLSLDAIIRTLYRISISHRNLLEWETSEASGKSQQNSIDSYIWLMLPASVPALALCAATIIFGSPPFSVFQYILAAAWLASPFIAYFASKPSGISGKQKIVPEDARTLRILARKTWRFFEDFATEENNWLCPDNYQQFPGPRLSDKTSPTNIGMQLISALSACDFGFISLRTLIDHCEDVMRTLQKMPKWNGHLYNWYNVRTLELLMPHYVSSVDSGNFLAFLITLKNGLNDLSERTKFSDALLLGMKDTIAAAGLEPDKLVGSFDSEQGIDELLEFLRSTAASPDTGEYWSRRFSFLHDSIALDMRDLKGTDGLISNLSIKELAVSGQPYAQLLMDRIHSISVQIDEMVRSTDFKVLYDPGHSLFHIGYNVTSQTADAGFYDLLASEARITSFLSIAKGDTTQKNWFALGRPLTLVRGVPTLVSWSGTMFEYLMPNLIMKTPFGTILSRSCIAAVHRQIAHGRKQKIPWGISESQYYLFDTDSNYQYAAFGMQYLRLQSSMKPVRVIAPYATALALGTMRSAAIKNIKLLLHIGAGGEYGLYEALDFNKPDSITLKPYSLVQSFMAHHQGMIMASINNCMHANILQKRFHSEAMVKSTAVLLEETGTDVLVSLARRGYSINLELKDFEEEKFENRYCNTINPKTPIAHVLSNNHYLLMLTSGGQGFSSCDNVMMHSWSPECTGSSHGNFVYIRNLGSDQTWSSTYYPTFAYPDEYKVIFAPDKVEYHRKDGLISTDTEITLSPSENYEIRRVKLTNHGDSNAEFELTSYMEVVNDSHLAQIAHPAFNKMFLELEYVQDRHLLIASRRKRSEEDKYGLVMHMVISESGFSRAVEYETDRKAFIGRGGTQILPQALKTRLPLSGHSGFALDPIMSLRAIVKVPANKSISVCFVTGYLPTRSAVLNLSNELRKEQRCEDVFRVALTSSRLEMKYLNITSQQLNAIQSLVGPLYYPSRFFRDRDDIINRNIRGQSSLWRFGISGDYPVMLLRVKNTHDLLVVKDALLAYEYLHLQTVDVDLVIIDEEDEGYGQSLLQAIMELTRTLKIYKKPQQKPSLFILRRFLLTNEESDLLSTVARIIISRKTGIYMTSYEKSSVKKGRSADNILLSAGDSKQRSVGVESFIPPVSLEFFNGIGGFSADGREYEMWLGTGRKTPAPWINVIANESFGFHVSETGAGYTWAGNSRENKLTDWSNDPVLDTASEAVYIKDLQSGAITSPASLRPGRGQIYQVRHGFGYSVFAHTELDLEMTMTLFAAQNDPVKLWILSIRDHSGQDRDLSVTLYAEWVLGALKEQCAPYVVTSFSALTQLLTARNVYTEFEKQNPAFLFSSEQVTSFTGDKKEFLGVGRSISYPLGLAAGILSNNAGACLEPCGAIQMNIHLSAGESKTMVLGLGQTENIIKAADLADKFRTVKKAQNELANVRDYWNTTLSCVRVKTPDRATDIMLNGWLVYQIISCRLHARSAFYQCGGAFGFRDQLQDVLSLLDVDADFAQNQIRLCSAHQFVEGDVQHWWQPVTGVGVRTRISDDMLWLPYVTASYVAHTGNSDILLEPIPYLEADELEPGQSEKMFAARLSGKTDSIYRHCLQAFDIASRFGVNGLPLMGGGDWNDGMNRVGIGGKGESVWLGWFFYAAVQKFLPLCLLMHDQEKYDQLNGLAEQVRAQIEQNAWDGQWYLRGFFDNGSTLGSHDNEECQIDSISQSWAALSGGGDPVRVVKALDSAKHFLVHQTEGVIQLLTPPFNKSLPDPGYIKGYFPGIRGNGGQYTHAALWLAMANAKAGRGRDSSEFINMLNPILATSTIKDVARYEKEPYVMSADVYMGGQFTGKAGWSWYTGSAGWMYQCLLHSQLGITRAANKLSITPAVPALYREWEIDYQYGSAMYKIKVENDSGQGISIQSITVDGVPEEGGSITLLDDGQTHSVLVIMSPESF